MQIGEALNAISDGHTIWKPEFAQRVCTALGIPYSEELARKFYSENYWRGAHMNPGCEGSMGVGSLELSTYVARQFGVIENAMQFFGRGSQAREYARLVREKLEQDGKI